jgi:Leucine-rich repeat (LRR) protein
MNLVKELTIHNCTFDDVTFLQNIDSKTIKKLVLSYNYITDFHFGKTPLLEILDLSNNRLKEFNGSNLENIKELTFDN